MREFLLNLIDKYFPEKAKPGEYVLYIVSNREVALHAGWNLLTRNHPLLGNSFVWWPGCSLEFLYGRRFKEVTDWILVNDFKNSRDRNQYEDMIALLKTKLTNDHVWVTIS